MSELETRPAGGGVLQATVVGIGCNNFGRRLDARSHRTRGPHGARGGDHLLRHRRHLRQRAERGDARCGAQGTARGGGDRRRSSGMPSGGPGHSGASRRWIRIAVEEAFAASDTDWIDLYQMHTPDPATPDRGDARDAHRAGQRGQDPVRRLVEPGGLADRGRGLDEHELVASPDSSALQNEYSLLNRSVEEEVIPACAQFDVGDDSVQPARQRRAHREASPRTASRPLARALPTAPAPTSRWLSDRNFDIVEALERVRAERGITLLDVAIGGLAAQPQVALGDRRRDDAGAGARQRSGRHAGARRAADLEELDRIAPRQ